MSSIERGEWQMIATAIMLIVAGIIGELSGALLYVGYRNVKVISFCLAVAVVVWGFLISRGKAWRPIVLALLIGAAGVATASALPGFRWTLRKEFFIKASHVRPGMPCEDAARLLASYRHWSVEPGHTSFAYRSGPGTEDVIVIECDERTARVQHADLSLD